MEEEKETKKEKSNVMQEVKDTSEELMQKIVEKGIESIGTTDLDNLYKLVDIHKDVSNEEYWKRKENMDMYGNYGRGNYGNYGANYGNYNGRGPSRGAYGEGYSEGYGEYGDGSYGRRGRDSKYRGDDHLDRMYSEYGRYQEGRQAYGAGSQEADKSFHYMVKALEDFVRVLYEEADTQQEKQMLKQSLQSMMM